jgi:hypothetical protein
MSEPMRGRQVMSSSINSPLILSDRPEVDPSLYYLRAPVMETRLT